MLSKLHIIESIVQCALKGTRYSHHFDNNGLYTGEKFAAFTFVLNVLLLLLFYMNRKKNKENKKYNLYINSQLIATALCTIMTSVHLVERVYYIFGFLQIVSIPYMTSLFNNKGNDLRQLVIGKVYSKEELAHYNQGDKFPKLIVTNINTSIDSVLLPTMSNAQDDPVAVKNMTRRAIKTSTYIMMPLMVGLVVCANSIVSLVLTDKWLPCVPFLRIFCFTYAFFPIHTANLNAIKAMGRSDLFLKLEIIKKMVGIIALVSTMWISVMAMAYSMLMTSVLSQIINSYPNKKLLDYSYFEQLRDMLPQICLSLAMGLIVWLVQLIGFNPLITLVLQFVLGVSIYILGSYIFKIDSFSYVFSIVKKFLRRNVEKSKN